VYRHPADVGKDAVGEPLELQFAASRETDQPVIDDERSSPAESTGFHLAVLSNHEANSRSATSS
jgi:hypothetical protein